MDENDSIDYKALYEKTKKDMKTLKSYAKNSMNTESSNLVQINLLVQLLEEVYDRCDSTSPKPNYMEISSESYDVIKRCTFDAIDAAKKGSMLSSTSASPMNAAMLKSLETDVAAETVRTAASSETPLYTEKEMSSALKSLRDDIIKTCEKEARWKLHQLQTKCGEIQYAHDLLGLELSELRGAGGQLCSECGELVKDKTTPPSSDEQSSITSNNTGGKVKAAAGVQRSQAGAVRAKSVWVEYHDPNLPDPAVPGDEQPIPFGGLHSPVIERLLNEWTDDHNKIMYLVSWVEGLSKLEILPEAFPRGLQIVEVNTMVRDGFLMLLLPLMRYMSLHKLVLFTRTAAGTGADLESEALFDIRIKVLNEANEYYHPSTSPSASRQTSVESSGPEAGLGRRPSSDILAGPKAGLNSVFQNTVSGVFTLVNITQQSLGALATMSGALIPPAAARSATANGTTIPAKSGPISELPHQPTPDSIRVAADMATPASAPSGGSDAAPVSVVSQWATFLGTKVIGGMSGIPNPVPATSVGAAETKPIATTEKSTFVAPKPPPAAVPASLAAAPVDGAVNDTGPEDLSLASPSPVAAIAAPSVATEAAPVVTTSSEGGPQLSAKDKMNAKLAALRQKSSKK
jgi:hypothetical protein